MITYESLRELALVLSKVTGYRYVAFCEVYKGDLFISFSAHEMSWHEPKSIPYAFWVGDLERQVLNLRDIPNLDWSKCQFDCKEAENEQNV